MAGYSGTPLLKKLGMKPGDAVYVSEVPEHYFDWLAPLPAGVQVREKLSGSLDFIHVFATEQKGFERMFIAARKRLARDGMLWISWPKKSSGVVTDLNENIIRDFGLKNGLVDVKVCAIDETWSGLKFMFRLKDR